MMDYVGFFPLNIGFLCLIGEILLMIKSQEVTSLGIYNLIISVISINLGLWIMMKEKE